MPHLRDFREWEALERTVYEPFFRSHPQYDYPRPPRHNRRYDAELTGFSLNNPSAVFQDRKRILLVANRYSRIVEEWKRALESQMDAVVLSCLEYHFALYQPREIDLVVLFDCTAAKVNETLPWFVAAGVPIAYCVVNGLDAPYAQGPDPLGHLDLAKLPHVAKALGSSAYLPRPGSPWRPDQRAGAAALMAQANLVLRLGNENGEDGLPRCTPVPFVPNGLGDGSPIAPGDVRPTLYLGDCEALAADVLETLERLFRQTPPEMAWEILVSSRDSLQGAGGSWRMAGASCPRTILCRAWRPVWKMRTWWSPSRFSPATPPTTWL